MSTDAPFLAAADTALRVIADAIERALAASDADADWRLADGILEIEADNGAKIVVNRHLPNREIWVAAKAGGFHFRPVDGRWRDTRGGGELGPTLDAILAREIGIAVTLPPLAAPADAG
jgi:CyaY protein